MKTIGHSGLFFAAMTLAACVSSESPSDNAQDSALGGAETGGGGANAGGQPGGAGAGASAGAGGDCEAIQQSMRDILKSRACTSDGECMIVRSPCLNAQVEWRDCRGGYPVSVEADVEAFVALDHELEQCLGAIAVTCLSCVSYTPDDAWCEDGLCRPGIRGE
jgi:hypothetical protein